MSTATKPSSNGTSATATAKRYTPPKIDAAKQINEAVTAEADGLIEIAYHASRSAWELLQGARYDAEDKDVDERLQYLAYALVAARLVQEYVDHAADAICHDRTPTSVRDVFDSPVKELPY